MPTPAQVIEALEDWGVEIRAYEPDGRPWHTHTTPGGWAPVGVMHHHTAGSASLLTSATSQAAMLRLLRVGTAAASRMAAEMTADEAVAAAVVEHLAAGALACHNEQDLGGGRRAGIPGPLCHFSPAMVPGTSRARLWLIGWGNVNHAGVGSSRTLDRCSAGTYNGQAPGPDNVDGNPRYWGLEYQHAGTAQPWPDALLEVGHRTACALCEVHGWARSSWPGSQVEHREHTRRKIDRSWTGDVRAAVRATAQRGTNMATPVTTAEIAAIAEASARKTLTIDGIVKVQKYGTGDTDATREPYQPDNPELALASWANLMFRHVDETRDLIRAMTTTVEFTRSQVAAIDQRLDVISGTLEETRARVESLSVGGVDIAALVTAVADELDARARRRLDA